MKATISLIHAATMTSFMQNMQKLTYYINACKKHNVKVLGPDINYSERSFAVQGDAIRFGLGGIKNVGDNAIDRLIAEREPMVSIRALPIFVVA